MRHAFVVLGNADVSQGEPVTFGVRNVYVDFGNVEGARPAKEARAGSPCFSAALWAMIGAPFQTLNSPNGTLKMGRSLGKFALFAAMALSCSGCVTPGSEGIRGNSIDPSVSISDRRAALKTVSVVESAPAGAKSLGGITARRCHRNFLEDEPLSEAVLSDLKTTAYGQGADLIKVVGIEKKTGLAANCWYVLEGKAEMYSLQKP
ncbi:hypothetical protein M2322_002767 [Rhodoblastus acidophilus]|uniref:hypothetical protein n=1 Tax=Rhodoblastus acidophilus TaxID=1074 RepID=UPI00222403A7|nr:hypothetical protein [Rhodoblastus acidophilus]MCW2317213.1 hypothetical protein [Rhodoblastus acidophilus]